MADGRSPGEETSGAGRERLTGSAPSLAETQQRTVEQRAPLGRKGTLEEGSRGVGVRLALAAPAGTMGGRLIACPSTGVVGGFGGASEREMGRRGGAPALGSRGAA